MAHFIGLDTNTEGKKFVNDVIQMYTDNKTGQYSKYLGTSQFFVTYFSINDVMSRADKGTGNFDTEIGPNSPLRFNEIRDFPMYNFPEITPEFIRDERGVNLELVLNDITILPNTVKPKHSDYVLVSLPNMKEMLFRVTDKEYNSIQSNDFYKVNLELRYIGDRVYDIIKPQVVERYQCIFKNIGTEDKCLIKDSDVHKILDLEAAIIELKQLFRDLYYNDDCGVVGVKTSQEGLGSCCPDQGGTKKVNMALNYNGHIYTYNAPSYSDNLSYYQQMNANTNLWAQGDYGYIVNDTKNGFTMRYDMYSIRFLNESKIFDGGVYSDYLYQLYDDRLPPDFDINYRRSLWYAILNKSLRYLSPYLFSYEQDIAKSTSMLVMMNYDAISIMLSELDGVEGDKLQFYHRYFSKALITSLIKLRENQVRPHRVHPRRSVCGNSGTIESVVDNGLFNSALTEDEDIYNENVGPEEVPELTYIENMIRDYFFFDGKMSYDLQAIIDEIIKPSLENYHKLMIVIYILLKIHDSYFHEVELNNEEKGRLSKWEKVTTRTN